MQNTSDPKVVYFERKILLTPLEQRLGWQNRRKKSSHSSQFPKPALNQEVFKDYQYFI